MNPIYKPTCSRYIKNKVMRRIIMEQSKLNKILDDHRLWLKTNGTEGKKANLRSANLSYANMRCADLSSADLSYADLSFADLRYTDLRYADLSYADLSFADLHYTDLRSVNLSYADLRYANLSSANLSYANMRCADLSSADLDFSAFPLWCGGLSIHIDDKQAKQLLYHLVQNVQYSKNTTKSLKKFLLTKTIIKKANEFHRIDECGKIVLELDKEELV